MATKIVTKNSSTAGSAPSASDLVQGELAVNVADKRLYTEDNAGNIVELGTNPLGEITANGGIALGDNDKATFGAGDDLQIYHNGSNSIITETGTGNLYLGGDNLLLTNGSLSAAYLEAITGGAVNIYHNGSTKLATTSTGLDVTGNMIADGVGIGTSSPAAPLSIEGSSTGEYDALILRNSNAAASGQSAAMIFEVSAGTSGTEAASVAKISGLRTGGGAKGDLLFHTTISGVSAEGMRIDSAGHAIIPAGVTLGTAAGVYAAANTLEDYEEGTWTPAFSGGDYTFTYNKQKGSYTRIGNRVFIDCAIYVHPTTAPSGTVDGNLSVTGLPYAHDIQNDVDVVGGVAHFKQLFMSGIETLAARLAGGSAFVFYDTLATNYPELAYAQASDVAADTRIRIQFSYPTNG